MGELFLLSERQMARISPHFSLSHGVPRVDGGANFGQRPRPQHRASAKAGYWERGRVVVEAEAPVHDHHGIDNHERARHAQREQEVRLLNCSGSAVDRTTSMPSSSNASAIRALEFLPMHANRVMLPGVVGEHDKSKSKRTGESY